MVVDNLDLMAVTVLPPKANSKPFIDPYTVLPLPVSLKLLKSVTRRKGQVLELHTIVEHTQLPPSNDLHVFRKPLDNYTLPNACSILRSEGPYHR